MNPMKQNQESMLRESIKHFLTSYHSGSSDYSSFESIFFRLIQTMLDPPLEITWFYAAVTYHSAKRNHPSSRVLATKDLLNLLISCSNLSSASKKIALLAPVVYDLYSVVCDTRGIEQSERDEAGKLVEFMVGYVMISAGVYDYGNEDVECDNAVVCFEDLIRVWTTDRGGGICNFVETLRMFFPLLSDPTCKRMNAGCGVRELVGIVLLELFFLRLLVSFSSRMCAEDVLNNTRDQAVQTIKGFRNCHFLGEYYDTNFQFFRKVRSSQIPRQNPTRRPSLKIFIGILFILIRTSLTSPTMNMNAPAMNLMDDQNTLVSSDEIVRNSLHHFSVESPESVSNFISLYHRLTQDLKDPPLEILWLNGYIVFDSYKPSSMPPLGKLLVAEEILEKVNDSSSLCSVLRKVAAIAPVVYLLYHLLLKFSPKDPSLREQIGIVVEGIANYISICCSQYFAEGGQDSDILGPYMLDLIRIWMVDPVRDSDESSILAAFFPTLGIEFQSEVTYCLGNLAGVVMSETLIFRLVLKISLGVFKEDIQRNVLNVAIQTIKGFQNFYFLDMLLKMLSGPTLPIAASMRRDDAVLLHKVLYDAVLLVDYSFYSGRWVQSSASQLKRLALAWVLAAERAIQFARAKTDQERVISYLNAFRECQLVAELTKWACDQAGIVDQTTIPDITNPRALIKWLLFLNGHGIEVFDNSMLVLQAKAVACISEVESESPELALRTGSLYQNVINLSETYEIGNHSSSPGAVCLPSARIDTGRKRKESLSGFQEPQVKQVKLDHLGGAVGDTFLSLSTSGLLKNGVSDDDMDLVG